MPAADNSTGRMRAAAGFAARIVRAYQNRGLRLARRRYGGEVEDPQWYAEAAELVVQHTRVTSLSVAASPEVGELSLSLRLLWPGSELWDKPPEASPFPPSLEPFWAMLWPGSWGIVQHLACNARELCHGKTMLDFAAGSGAAAIAAVALGADRAIANEIDPYAGVAIGLNAQLNDVDSATLSGTPPSTKGLPVVDGAEHAREEAHNEHGRARLLIDIADRVGDVELPLVGADRVDVLVAGDVCYDEELTSRLTPWLRGIARRGTTVLIGDPGRAFLPGSSEIECVGEYELPTVVRETSFGHTTSKVWRVLP